MNSNPFDIIFVNPILNVLVLLYHAFLSLHLPGAFGFAIIALTIIIRVILHPFFHKQMHTTKKMADLKPHLDTLSKKHKGDAKRLQQEQMKAYQEAGVNPAAGCLLALVQLPVFLALYQTLNLFIHANTSAKIIASVNQALYPFVAKITTLDPHFFGLNLALSPSQMHTPFAIIIPAVTALLQYFQTSVSLPATPAPSAPTLDKDGKPVANSGEDFQKAMNMQMKYVLPLLFGYISWTLPTGLALYWNIFSLFSIMQYKVFQAQNAKNASAVVVAEPVVKSKAETVKPVKKLNKKKGSK